MNGRQKRAEQLTKVGSIEYTETKVSPVASETLIKNRVIANQEHDPRSVPFRMLRTKVLREMRKKSWSALAITAPTAGVGKSLIAANLAVSIALEANQTVLLVDMDLRRPSVHKYFSITPSCGMRDYIEHRVEIPDMLINPGIERLVLLPSNKGVLNTSELLATPEMAELIKELKSRYSSRFIIFDLPPLLVTDDALTFFPYVDCSLFIVEEGVTTKEQIKDSLNMLEATNLIGTVLNKGESQSHGYYYY